MDQDLVAGVESPSSSWMDQDLVAGVENQLGKSLPNELIFQNRSANDFLNNEEAEHIQDVPAEFSRMHQTEAEQRFMGSQGQNVQDKKEIQGSTYTTSPKTLNTSKVLDTLRRVALLASDSSSVRSKWFELVDDDEEEDVANNDPGQSALQDEVRETLKLQNYLLDYDSESECVESRTSLDEGTIQTPDVVSPTLNPDSFSNDSSFSVGSSSIEDSQSTSSNITNEPIDEPEPLVSIIPVAPTIEDDEQSVGFFADLQTKNEIFGDTMELDSRKLTKSIETSKKWRRDDDELFSGKTSHATHPAMPHKRKLKKSKSSSTIEPITQEINLQVRKHSRIMEALTKKR